MSEQRPPYYATIVPDTDWSEAHAARFDATHGLPTYPGTTDAGKDGMWPAYPGDQAKKAPPLNPRQPTPNDMIAEAARAALSDIVQVIGLWPYPGVQTPALHHLRDLLQAERRT